MRTWGSLSATLRLLFQEVKSFTCDLELSAITIREGT